MKNHEIAKIINDLRDIGYKYAGTQQLRTMIYEYLAPILEDLNEPVVEKEGFLSTSAGHPILSKFMQ